MKFNFSLASILLLALCTVAAQAQYLTSTKAGFVNYVEGKVHILRADSEDGEKGRASLGTQMRDGDRLFTTAGGHAEILLNPGSYIRLSENAEVVARNTDFGAPRFELVKGSVHVEVGDADKATRIEIMTPGGSLFVTKDGLYRIDEKNGATTVSVRQGEVLLGGAAASQAARIKRGKVFTLSSGAQTNLAKLDRDASDKFDVWCFSRGQLLAAANLRALRQNRTYSAFNGGWYYDSLYNCYTFMPFGRRFFSPFGFGFFRNWQDCYWYDPYYNPYGGRYYGNGGNGGGGVVAGLPSRVITGNDRAPIRREAEGRVLDTGSDSPFSSGRSGGRYGGDFPSSSSGSVMSAPAATSVISAPAPSRDSGGGSSGGAMPSRP
jgi:FecR protein